MKKKGISAVFKKIAACALAFGMVFSAAACEFNFNPGGNSGGGNKVEDPNKDPIDNPNGNPEQETKLPEGFENLQEVRFSSVYAYEEGKSCKMKMRVPFTDTYSVVFQKEIVEKVTLYDDKGEEIASGERRFNVELSEGQLVYLDIVPVDGDVKVDVTAKNNRSQLPFSVAPVLDTSGFETTSADPTVDPLKPAELTYKKRDNTLYVYANAPEGVSDKPEVINNCITRKDVSDQSVFFTFEHNSLNLNPGIYYGYRVRNTGTEDMYVTVRNIGYQREGSWLGDDEWTQFYNTSFGLPFLSKFTESQRGTWKAYFGFMDVQRSNNYQPVTYRIPAGKYIYVIGGTTEDAYCNFNVGGTANFRMSGGCQNGAVLFDVAGTAEGSYYIYNDPAKIRPGTAGGDAHLGIYDAIYGDEHTGDDVGYVVDGQACWVFNDATIPQKLPVTFTNSYGKNAPSTGTPGAEIPYITERKQTQREWVTHINIHNVSNPSEVIGTDMTSFHTLGPDGKPVIVGCSWYDTRGQRANLGNWMKDYQDSFTFVNQGDNSRTVEIYLRANGAIIGMIRNPDGTVVKDTANFYPCAGKGSYGDGFEEPLRYRAVIPAHSVVQLIAEYNLMANSAGYLKHYVELM